MSEMDRPFPSLFSKRNLKTPVRTLTTSSENVGEMNNLEPVYTSVYVPVLDYHRVRSFVSKLPYW